MISSEVSSAIHDGSRNMGQGVDSDGRQRSVALLPRKDVGGQLVIVQLGRVRRRQDLVEME